MYIHGGYYFSAGAQGITGFRPNEKSELVAARGCGGGCFSREFMGSKPKHPIIAAMLRLMLEQYEKHEDRTLLGPVAMANAYHASVETDQVGVQLLELAFIKHDESSHGKSPPNHPG